MVGQSPYMQTDRSVLNRYINIANGIVLSDEIFFKKKKKLLTLGKNLQVKQIQIFLD